VTLINRRRRLVLLRQISEQQINHERLAAVAVRAAAAAAVAACPIYYAANFVRIIRLRRQRHCSGLISECRLDSARFSRRRISSEISKHACAVNKPNQSTAFPSVGRLQPRIYTSHGAGCLLSSNALNAKKVEVRQTYVNETKKNL